MDQAMITKARSGRLDALCRVRTKLMAAKYPCDSANLFAKDGWDIEGGVCNSTLLARQAEGRANL